MVCLQINMLHVSDNLFHDLYSLFDIVIPLTNLASFILAMLTSVPDTLLMKKI